MHSDKRDFVALTWPSTTDNYATDFSTFSSFDSQHGHVIERSPTTPLAVSVSPVPCAHIADIAVKIVVGSLKTRFEKCTVSTNHEDGGFITLACTCPLPRGQAETRSFKLAPDRAVCMREKGDELYVECHSAPITIKLHCPTRESQVRWLQALQPYRNSPIHSKSEPPCEEPTPKVSCKLIADSFPPINNIVAPSASSFHRSSSAPISNPPTQRPAIEQRDSTIQILTPPTPPLPRVKTAASPLGSVEASAYSQTTLL